jgi:hypothetical protein
LKNACADSGRIARRDCACGPADSSAADQSKRAGSAADACATNRAAESPNQFRNLTAGFVIIVVRLAELMFNICFFCENSPKP